MKSVNAKDKHSAVKAPTMGQSNGASKTITSGKAIVMKPINAHRANPAYGKK